MKLEKIKNTTKTTTTTTTTKAKSKSKFFDTFIINQEKLSE
jgi:hypothetical protein